MSEISLKKYNTFNISATCQEIHFIKQVNDLDLFFGMLPNQYYILGGGSNVLLLDNIHKIILKNEIKGIELIHDLDYEVVLRVGGGEIWNDLVQWSVEHHYSGIENLSLIPGTVGAAPVQNIGAYGVELKDVLVRVEGVNITEGKIMTINNVGCQFGYRDSIFKHELKDVFFITHIHLKLSKIPKLNIDYAALKQELVQLNIITPTAKDISEVVTKIRKQKLPDPAVIGNAGSFFKNTTISKNKYDLLLKNYPTIPMYPVDDDTVKIPSAWLIEQAGWKGFRNGDAGCHEKQALVLVNYGNASGKDIYELALQIIASVEHKFGVRLTMEVNLWN